MNDGDLRPVPLRLDAGGDACALRRVLDSFALPASAEPAGHGLLWRILLHRGGGLYRGEGRSALSQGRLLRELERAGLSGTFGARPFGGSSGSRADEVRALLVADHGLDLVCLATALDTPLRVEPRGGSVVVSGEGARHPARWWTARDGIVAHRRERVWSVAVLSGGSVVAAHTWADDFRPERHATPSLPAVARRALTGDRMEPSAVIRTLGLGWTERETVAEALGSFDAFWALVESTAPGVEDVSASATADAPVTTDAPATTHPTRPVTEIQPATRPRTIVGRFVSAMTVAGFVLSHPARDGLLLAAMVLVAALATAVAVVEPQLRVEAMLVVGVVGLLAAIVCASQAGRCWVRCWDRRARAHAEER